MKIKVLLNVHTVYIPAETKLKLERSNQKPFFVIKISRFLNASLNVLLLNGIF